MRVFSLIKRNFEQAVTRLFVIFIFQQEFYLLFIIFLLSLIQSDMIVL